MPSSPVQALAQPLLTRTARTAPLDAARCSLLTMTPADCTRLVVKTPAACAGASETSSIRSGAPLALMPALMPAARNPRGVVTPPVDGRMAAAGRHAGSG